MKKYRGLKCPECGWINLKIKYGKVWICERCKSRGMVDDLYKDSDDTDKKELSDEWKKITGEE